MTANLDTFFGAANLEGLVDRDPARAYVVNSGEAPKVAWHAQLVSDGALEELEAKGRGAAGPIDVFVFHHSWYFAERVSGPAPFLRRLEESKFYQRAVSATPFQYRQFPHDLADDLGTFQNQLVEAWDRSSGVIDGAFIEHARAAGAMRYMSILAPGDAHELVYRFIGPGFSKFTPRHRLLAMLGQPADCETTRYSRWYSNAYRQAFRAGEPQRSICDARTPYGGYRRQRRIHSDRTILPSRFKTGEPVVVVASHVAAGLHRLNA